MKINRIQRRKYRVLREKSLESAFKIFPSCKSIKGVIEVQYYNEVGTGLGPTLEFYSLVSKGFQRKSLEMWVCEKEIGNKEESLVYARFGLFPLPIDPTFSKSEYEYILKRFEIFGSFVAKAIQDDRLIDIPLSYPFYKIMLGKKLTINDLSVIYPQFGITFLKLVELCKKRKNIKKNYLNQNWKKNILLFWLMIRI